jgi:hypothetical protein
VYTLLVFVVLQFVVEPRLYDRRQYNALLVVLVLIMLGEAHGLPGILAAPPLAAALQILMTRLLAPASTPAAQPVEEQLAALGGRLRSLRAALGGAGETAGPQVASLVARLEALLGQAGSLLQAGGPVAGGADSCRVPAMASAADVDDIKGRRRP